MKIRRMFFSLIAFVFILGMTPDLFAAEVGGKIAPAAATKFISPKGIAIDFAAREKQAPQAIRLRLDSLRQEIAKGKHRFQVGYTAALDFDLAQITGAVVPGNIAQLAAEQDAKATEAAKSLPAAAPLPGYSVSASSFDWRKANGVTPVKDQGNCGSCWAFATVAAFEGSWRVFNGQLINASEEDILDCNLHGWGCGGGWWAFDQIVSPPNRGLAAEAAYPYTHIKTACNTAVPRPYKAQYWGYVPRPASLIPTVAMLKQYLLTYGPLGVAVYASPAFQAYTGGVFDQHAPNPINHAVTLIGWDDSKQAWLIKNSWGTGWGSTCEYGTERGYMWIAYDSNKIGFNAAYVRAQMPLLNLTGRWRGNDGGTYYMNQHGIELWWLGMSADNGATWTNVFRGNINLQTLNIAGQWSDVPHGKINNHGTLNLHIESFKQLKRTGVTGGFGGSQWDR